MGSGTVWFGGEWSLVQAWESPFLVFNGICSRTLSQVSVGVPHHAALTGVTGPSLPGDDSSTAFGIPVLGLQLFGAAHGAHPASAPSWNRFVLGALGGGCWGWLWPSGMGERADP